MTEVCKQQCVSSKANLYSASELKPAGKEHQVHPTRVFNVSGHFTVLYLEALCCFTQLQNKEPNGAVYNPQRRQSCALLKGVSWFWRFSQPPHPGAYWIANVHVSCRSPVSKAEVGPGDDSSCVSTHPGQRLCCSVRCWQTAVPTEKPDEFCL